MSDKPPPYDVVFLHSLTPDGEGIRVIRSKDGNLHSGEIRALQEGKPLVGAEIVQLVPRAESPKLWDVKVQCEVSGPARTHAGPARVATPAYREHWDSIFHPGQDDDDDTGGNSSLN